MPEGERKVVEQPVADPSQRGGEGVTKGMPEDNPEVQSEEERTQEAFILDMFAQDLDTGALQQDDEIGVAAPEEATTQENEAAKIEAEKVSESSPVQAASQNQVKEVGKQETVEPEKVVAQPSTPQASRMESEGKSPSSTFAQLQEAVAQNQQVFEKALAETVYKLDEEMQEALQNEPHVAVPKLMSRLHLNVVQNVLGTLAQQMPAAIGGVIKAERRYREMEDSFYAKWPTLSRKEHGAVVQQFARSYRAANPDADFDTMVKMVGAQAIVALGLTASLGPTAAQQNGQGPRRVTPGPQVRAASKPPQFGPAGVGVTPGARKQADHNPWEEMDRVIKDDDMGLFD